MPRQLCLLLFFSVIGFSILYAAIAIELPFPHFIPAYGPAIYDQYYLALIDGRADLPPFVVRYEGHYTEDGKAFLYHGLAPLLTRLALTPVITIGQVSLAPVSIWFWAVLGTSLYHLLLARWLLVYLGDDSVLIMRLQAVLAIGIWFGGPGLLLVANTALYHEPISVAYALVAGFLCLVIWPPQQNASKTAEGDLADIGEPAFRWRLLAMATLAGLTVHARPSVAIGMYAIVGLLCLYEFRRDWRSSLLPVGLAGCILLIAGLSYLGFNAYRMGSPFAVHGSFSASSIQYGSTFLGLEEADSVRAQSFEDNGRFSPLRIIPNLMVYLVDFEYSPISALVAFFHDKVVSSLSGFVRIEGPSVGVLFLWPVWMLLAWRGRRYLDLRVTPLHIVLVGLLVTTLLTLSYGTIALRYRIDIWPLIAVLAIMGLKSFKGFSSDVTKGNAQVNTMAVIVGFGVLVSAVTAFHYSYNFRYNLFSIEWTDTQCAQIMAEAGFTAPEVPNLCRRP